MAVALAASFRAFRVFVSYSSRDDSFAQNLVDYLEREQKISCFFAPRNIPGLQDWQSRLSSEVRQCDVVVFLYTPEAVESEYVRFEISEAAEHGRPVWLVKERNTRLDLSFAHYQFVKRNAFVFHAGQEAECFTVLRDALHEEWEGLNRGMPILPIRDSSPLEKPGKITISGAAKMPGGWPKP
jgi:hypothetical protein